VERDFFMALDNKLLFIAKRLCTLIVVKNGISLISKRKLPLKSFVSNLYFAISLTGFGTTYSVLKKRLPFWSGCIASLWLLVDKDKKHAASLAQILVLRTLYFAIRSWIYEQETTGIQVRKSNIACVSLITKVLHQYGSTLVWILSAYRICYTNFVNPDYFTKSYFGFLIYMLDGKNRFGVNADGILRNFSRINHLLVCYPHRHPIEFIPPDTATYHHIVQWKNELKGTEIGTCLETTEQITKLLPPGIHHDRFGCANLHPQYSSCSVASLQTIKDVFRMTYKTHVFLNLISFVISIVKKARKRNHITFRELVQLVFKAALQSFRSCFMMAVYFGVYTLSVCYLRLLFGRERLIIYGLAGVLATPTILIDRPGRLLELNFFTVSKCLESFVLQLKRNQIVDYNR
jgi:hypothetical protein